MQWNENDSWTKFQLWMKNNAFITLRVKNGYDTNYAFPDYDDICLGKKAKTSITHWTHSRHPIHHPHIFGVYITWWRHQMETFSALLAHCAGNSPVTGEFPAQRPLTRSFNVFFDLHLINCWVNNGEAGDLRCHHDHYDITIMMCILEKTDWAIMGLDHTGNVLFFIIASQPQFGQKQWTQQESNIQHLLSGVSLRLSMMEHQFSQAKWLVGFLMADIVVWWWQNVSTGDSSNNLVVHSFYKI